MSTCIFRCLVIDGDSIEAQKYLILHSVCFEGQYAEARFHFTYFYGLEKQMLNYVFSGWNIVA